MLVVILTVEQKNLIQGVEMQPNNTCNCIQDINDNWVIDEISISLLDLEWLNNLPLITFVPKPFVI